MYHWSLLVFTWSLLLGKICKRPLDFTKPDCKQPKYSIAISVTMIISFLLFILIQKFFPKETHNKPSKKLYFIISALILLSLIITYSVIYCYMYEMAHEVV